MTATAAAMHPATTPQRLVFPAARTVVSEAFTPPAPGPEQVLIKTRWSLISTGTESIVYGRRFDPGTHWDGWVKYPFTPGYSAVGTVAAVGARVTSHRIGDRVACRAPHASHAVVDAAHCWHVPDGVELQDAAWFALAKIAAMGARAAPMQLGDRVLVIGAGPIGQMSLRWALSAGAERVALLDPIAPRLALGRQGGATHLIEQPLATALPAVKAAFAGELPNLVVDATGHPDVLSQALGLAADRGTVLIIGDTGRPAQQHLTFDVVCRGLRIVGAHDGHEDARWHSGRIVPFFFQQVATGRFRLQGLTTHTFAPRACAQAYELVEARRGETMGICFDWEA